MNNIYKEVWLNKVLITAALGGIIMTYLFQELRFIADWDISENAKFIFRKSLRVLLNDLFMLAFIALWFKDRKITRLALIVQIIDSLVLLPIYLVIKLTVEGTSEISLPLLSQLHRLIVNPTLMILLIPAVYFQKLSKKE
ncbi:hypothetical protein WSM22_43440 [Cytophagales bacterium WSM2-2]|nr:hypothetical protein WSM22_43440 [Cytophagales bacterium WSM2-2]